MRESVPRFVLVLTGIVAIAALCLGIKDHFEQEKNSNDPASGTPTLVRSDATTKQKKIPSAKTRQQRLSAAEGTAPAESQGLTNDLEKSLIRQESAKSEAKPIVAMDHGSNGAKVKGAQRELEATDETNRLGHERNTNPNSALPTCLPLPNGTELGDVDAPYYGNWAGEYCNR